MKTNDARHYNINPTLIIMRTFAISLLSILLIGPVWSQNTSIVDLGAKGDGTTLNTKIIQQAIDKVHGAGGGTVVVPEGRFLTGTINLKSNVNLHLEENAVILGSTDPYDYPFMKEVLVKGQPETQKRGALIVCENQSNVKISGPGTIDGQGRDLALNIDSLFYAGKLDIQYYNLRRKRPGRRPGDIVFYQCDHVSVTGVTIRNSGSWVQTYELCKNLVIDRIRVESDAYWNNDGMDIVDCVNVLITNSFVNSADDGICLKSENKGFLDDSIYIANCTVRSSASAVKFGTASVGGFRNIVIKHIYVYDTFRSAIALESVDGGILENVLVDSVIAVNTGNPVFIRLGHRNTDDSVGDLRNVIIRNIQVEVPYGPPDLKYEIRGPELDFFHNPFPSSIAGIPGHPVENVTLENIHISYPGRGNKGYAILPVYRLESVPEVESGYPEFSMFGELPAWAFYVRHVKGLTLKNITVTAAEKDYRPAYVFDDVENLSLDMLTISKANLNPPVVLRKVTGEKLQNINTPEYTGKKVRVIGE